MLLVQSIQITDKFGFDKQTSLEKARSSSETVFVSTDPAAFCVNGLGIHLLILYAIHTINFKNVDYFFVFNWKKKELLWPVQYFCSLNWQSLPFGHICINVAERYDRLIPVLHRMAHHCKHQLCREAERIRLASYTIMIIHWVVDMDIFKIPRFSLDNHNSMRAHIQKMKFNRNSTERGEWMIHKRCVSWQSELKNNGQYHILNQFNAQCNAGKTFFTRITNYFSFHS